MLGVPARRGRNTAKFTNIEQPWLRESVKEWCRFRLEAGYAFATIDATGQSMSRFSTFLTGRPEVVDATGLSRELIEAFLVWVATSGLAASTRSATLCFLKGFLEWRSGCSALFLAASDFLNEGKLLGAQLEQLATQAGIPVSG